MSVTLTFSGGLGTSEQGKSCEASFGAVLSMFTSCSFANYPKILSNVKTVLYKYNVHGFDNITSRTAPNNS